MKPLFKTLAILSAFVTRPRSGPWRPVRQCGSHRPWRLKSDSVVRLSNIAEGQHLSSQGITYEADAAITERNLLVKRGSAANRIAICAAADIPIGVCSDESAAAADLVNVRPFNSDLTLNGRSINKNDTSMIMFKDLTYIRPESSHEPSPHPVGQGERRSNSSGRIHCQ